MKAKNKMMKPIFLGKFNNLSWKTSGSFDQSFSVLENVINLSLFIIFCFFSSHMQPLGGKAHKEPWEKNDSTKSSHMIETGTKIQININNGVMLTSALSSFTLEITICKLFIS